MTGIIILVILFIIFWPVIRVFLAIRRATREARRAFSGRQSTGERSHRADTSGHRKRRKVFSRNEGEYVEFEEVTVTEERKSSNGTSKTTVKESQVEDAEWEDVR